MKYKNYEAIKNGEIVKNQAFITERGAYQITLLRYKNEIYFCKYLNGKLVECCNLNRSKRMKAHKEETTDEKNN